MFVFVLLGIALHPFWFAAVLGEKERAGCFAVVDLWVCCCCGCSVALSHSALGRSTVCGSVCGFGIS